MLLHTLAVTPAQLQQGTGWEIRPEGACAGDVCVPLRDATLQADGKVDVEVFADQMGMPLAYDETHDLWALGPRAGGRVLASDAVPPVVLDDFSGAKFDVGTLRGRKVLLLAWASW